MTKEEPPGKRVLIIDDDFEIRSAFKLVLEDEGYRVLTAGQAREGLELLRRDQQVGLILLDLMLPEVSGAQFRQIQRADPGLRDIPVVLISAEEDVASASQELEADAFLSKPIDLDALVSTVARCHRSREGSDS